MADAILRGRLVAIDGSDGKDLSDAATTLLDALTERQLSAGVSSWDASGLFTDVVSAPAPQRDVSPRTLVLLYAADLAFRLRWEIAPALAQGMVVIAAPYVTTAVTFGIAAGLSREWLLTLFRFAPVATRTAILRPTGPDGGWKRRPERGLCECCTTLLEATPEGFQRRKTRMAMTGALSTAAEKHGGLHKRKDLKDLVEEIVKPRRRRAASKPKTRRGR